MVHKEQTESIGSIRTDQEERIKRNRSKRTDQKEWTKKIQIRRAKQEEQIKRRDQEARIKKNAVQKQQIKRNRLAKNFKLLDNTFCIFFWTPAKLCLQNKDINISVKDDNINCSDGTLAELVSKTETTVLLVCTIRWSVLIRHDISKFLSVCIQINYVLFSSHRVFHILDQHITNFDSKGR